MPDAMRYGPGRPGQEMSSIAKLELAVIVLWCQRVGVSDGSGSLSNDDGDELPDDKSVSSGLTVTKVQAGGGHGSGTCVGQQAWWYVQYNY